MGSIMDYRAYKGYILDLDGVIWLGNRPMPGASEAIERLREADKKIMFVSNTSSRSRAQCLDNFRNMGLSICDDELVLAGEMTANYIASVRPGAVAYVMGSAPLLAEMQRAGLDARMASDRNPRPAEFLVVGKDTGVDFLRLTCALRVLRQGAKFVAVNQDPTVPSPDGLEPGAGAVVAAVSYMSGREPDIVVGKPGTVMLEMALRHWGLSAEECAIVGDTPESDVAAGKRLGMGTILVLSGNSEESSANGGPTITKPIPDWVISSVADLVA